MNKGIFSLLTFLSLLTLQTAAQVTPDRWAVRVGYLRSIPVLAKATVMLPVPLSQIGIRPIDSYYVGAIYTTTWHRLSWRTEFNYQRIGMTGYDAGMIPVDHVNEYHYLGLTPTVGFTAFQHVSIYVGPEIDFLLAKNSLFSHSNPVEIGVSARVGYRLKSVEFVVGGSKGFTNYAYTVSGGQSIFYYRNQNWQVGLVYSFFAF